MKLRHTEGIWIAVKYPQSVAWKITLTPDHARGDLGNVIAGLGAKDHEVAANARLMAAAPRMLKALLAVNHNAVTYADGELSISQAVINEVASVLAEVLKGQA